MIRSAIVIAGLAVVIAAAGLFFLKGKGFNVELTEQQIQLALDSKFPVEKAYPLLFTLTLSDPKVTLKDGADRINFGVKATVEVHLGIEGPMSGTGEMNTGLRYNPNDFSFYLDDPIVEKLEIQGIPVKYVDKVSEVATKLAKDQIDNYSIYTLQREDAKQKAASLVLKDLFVRNGKLIIVLGI